MNGTHRSINAPGDRVADAVSCPFHLGVWLADEAFLEKRPAGRVVLWWHEGTQMTGRWTRFEPPHDLAWTLTSEDGRRVDTSFHMESDGSVTRLSVLGDRVSEDWAEALENLAAYVETGVNRREMQRPMVGISYDILDPEKARASGADIDGGVLVSATVENGGAQAAGIMTGDLLELVGATRVRDWPDLVTALRGHKAGDTIDLTYWRNGQRSRVTATLGGRETPAVETDPQAMAERVASYARERLSSLQEVIGGADDRAAGHQPGPGEWSAKEVLSHLYNGELWWRDWALGAAYGTRVAEYPERYDEALRRFVQGVPIGDVVSALVDAIRATEVLQGSLLADNPAPSVMHAIAVEMHRECAHFDEHMAQVKAAIASAG